MRACMKQSPASERVTNDDGYACKDSCGAGQGEEEVSMLMHATCSGEKTCIYLNLGPKDAGISR